MIIQGATLIDDMGGWLTAMLDIRRAWTGDGASVSADVDELLDAVTGFGSHLVVVSPEVGLTVVPAPGVDRTEKRPPSDSVRSRIPTSPKLWRDGTASTSKPSPSSTMPSTTGPPWRSAPPCER